MCEGIDGEPRKFFRPSTSWAYGGTISERERICIAWLAHTDTETEHYCVAHIDGVYVQYGPTPLVAAMRCYVASKLGDTVNIPDEIFIEETS